MLVAVYLALNAVVVGDALVHLATGSAKVSDWWSALTTEHSSALAVIGVALVAFPKLALGLSGFETGVLVMPQVAAGEGSGEERLAKWQEEREVNRIPPDQPTVFLEVSVADASAFESGLKIKGEERF